MGMGGVAVGVEFDAVLAMAAAQGADLEMTSDVLPEFETALLSAMAGDEGEE